MSNPDHSSKKSDLVRKFDDELSHQVTTLNKAGAQSAPSPAHRPYIRMDYDGHSLFVSTILENQAKALHLIAAMTAMVPFLPATDEEPRP